MSTDPKIGAYLDEEERELATAIDATSYAFGQDNLSKDRLTQLQSAARTNLNEERQKISIRVRKSVLARLKARAMREGIPYQTAINSLIYKYVQNNGTAK